jgi:hypothetical protein
MEGGSKLRADRCRHRRHRCATAADRDQAIKCSAAENGKGKNCKAIKGATRSSFTPGKRYVGTRLTVAVTAGNSAGNTTVTSKASKVVSA